MQAQAASARSRDQRPPRAAEKAARVEAAIGGLDLVQAGFQRRTRWHRRPAGREEPRARQGDARVRVAGERRHGTGRDGAGGAAHVEVNHIGIILLNFQRGLQDEFWIVAIDLKRDGTLRLGEIHALGGLFRFAEDLLHFDELGITHCRPQGAANRTEGPVRVAVHGREDRVSKNGNVADIEVRSSRFVHKRRQV